ncbi:MAG: polyprenyl synthetase family protein [bacterium]|nr:polyprenyl synthetase family protein [bacterium]
MKDHSSVYRQYKQKVDDVMSGVIEKKYPATLYEPIKYVLSSGGKRIRPMMVIFSCEAFGGKIEDALNAGVAMELLHNFTLVHDDIMDNADVRRGMETIHKKWNANVAILSGDHLIGLAYEYLLRTNSNRINDILKIFSEGITEVCEGQSYDKEFEERSDVTSSEYLMMIGKKTAKMLETSAAIGALIGGADNEQAANMKQYAKNTGLAFQIQDDLLDINADETEFGKRIGGDIVEGKKTFLLLRALEKVKETSDRTKLMDIVKYNGLKEYDESKIMEIKNIYSKYGIIEDAKNDIENYTKLADQRLDILADGESKDRLKWLSSMLMDRSF